MGSHRKANYILRQCVDSTMSDDEADVRAMHQRDLKEYLGSLGILQQITAGKFNCVRCGDLISVERIGTISKRKGEIRICCDKTSCLTQFLSTEGSTK